VASERAQAAYFRLLGFETGLLILGALVSSMTTMQSVVGFVAAVSILMSLVINVVSRQRRFEDAWFDWRAIAETAKSLTWKYAMRSPPLGRDSDGPVDAAFTRLLDDVLRSRRKADDTFVAAAAADQQITPAMRALRGQPLAERCSEYRRERIQNQQKWYSTQALAHARADSRWFFAYLSAQAVGGGLAVASLAFMLPLRPVAVVTTIASVALAWHKAQRHRDLASAYTMAAHEIGLIGARFDGVATEEALHRGVAEAEAAISREHTMWHARRPE
jgi:hypothetical protein